MKHSAWHAFFLGWILIIGGLHGYMNAGSLISLVAGILLGGILLTSTYMLLGGDKNGGYVAFVTTLFVLLKFAPEFQVSGDVYPAGLLSAVSVWVLGAFLVNWIDEEHAPAH